MRMQTLDSLKKNVREYLSTPLPERVGWPHIFGSMLLALFVLQFLSGILLSFVYSASPLSAHRSMSYLMNEMDGGAWLRGIHYWGASTIIIVLALHLIRTFVYAAYKKPRHLTWILGVLLLLCTLAFAQTGYLLPWDQRSYWGTKVTLEIVGTAPVLGPILAYIARGAESVGALTLSRFFTIHTMILPLITTALIAGHLYFIRKHGITSPWTDVNADLPKTIPFNPYQTAKDSTGMLLITACVLILAWLVPAPLGRLADPNDSTFSPRPDWYFLFLFESLKFFQGKLEILGTVVLPTVAILLLLLLPFYDRNPSRRIRKRPLAMAGLLFAIATWGSLTYSAMQSAPHPLRWAQPHTLPRAERIKKPSQVGGMYVLQYRCFECHSMTVLGKRANLQALVGTTFPNGEAWLNDHLAKQGKNEALTKKEAEELMSVLPLVAHEDARLLYTIPVTVRVGAHKFYNSSCAHCHTVDGQGGKQAEVKSPDLTLRLLRSREWHIEHIRDSRTKVPNSKMPPFLHYETEEYEALADYILYLHSP